jgi:GNAT superfamily N-acetyltransferase
LPRRATASDADAIARLHIASWSAAYAAELPAWYLDGQDVQARTALWSARIADPQTAVCVQEVAHRLVGFCASGPSRDADADASVVWEIQNLHVAPELRGGGIGSVLFTDALERAWLQGATELTLWVVETNAPARAFYARRGMHLDGANQRHVLEPGVSLNEIRYRRRVDAE